MQCRQDGECASNGDMHRRCRNSVHATSHLDGDMRSASQRLRLDNGCAATQRPCLDSRRDVPYLECCLRSQPQPVAIAVAASYDRSRSCQKFNALRKIASLSRATVKIIKLRGCPKRPGNPIGFRAHRLNIETPVRCHAATSVRKTHRNNDMQNATKHRFFGNTRDEATKRQTPPTSRFPTIFRRDA